MAVTLSSGSSLRTNGQRKPTMDEAEVVNEEGIPNGIPRMLPYITSLFGLMTAVFASLWIGFRHSSSILGLPPPAPQYCPPETVCTRADLFAFQMVSFIPIVLCGLSGIYVWYFTRRVHTAIPQTPEGRLFSPFPEGEAIASICFTFQFWDFFISLLLPEHRTLLMLAHHLMAAAVSWCAVRYTCLQYYAVFYLALSEVSSIFLVWVDLAQYFPPQPGTAFDTVIGILCGPLFALSFILYRVIYWWPISLQLFRDIYHVFYTTGSVYKLRPGKEWVLYIFMGCNIPLGLLQLYWMTIILQKAKEQLL